MGDKDIAPFGLRLERDGINFMQYLDDVDVEDFGREMEVLLGFADIKRVRFKFPNGYGISVIHGAGTYGASAGLFEIGVLRYEKNGDFHLTYDTPVADDVVGYLSGNEVGDYMVKIFRLPPHTPALPE